MKTNNMYQIYCAFDSYPFEDVIDSINLKILSESDYELKRLINQYIYAKEELEAYITKMAFE